MFFVPMAIVADAPTFATVRADADASLRAMLSVDQRAGLAAVERGLRDDIRAVFIRARERTGGIAAVLTDEQHSAIVRAVMQGQEPNIQLSDAQTAKLQAFAAVLRDGLVPAWRARAHAADALLTAAQRVDVLALRDRTAATTGAAIASVLPGPFALLPTSLRAPFAPTFDDVAAIVSGPDGAGGFALLVDLPLGGEAPVR